MIQSFKNKAVEDIFNGAAINVALRICPRKLWKIAMRKLDQLDSVSSVNELCIPPGNMLEMLTGNCHGQYSIRINDQYRIFFQWHHAGPIDVEITNYY